MSIQHNVRQGECLSSIAKRYGFADWRTIYEDPQNTEFRQSRPNPNLIYPGDQLWIPDKSPKKLPISTETKHTLQLKSSLTRLRLVLKDEEGKPIASVKYQLAIGDTLNSGFTSGSGLVEQVIPADAQEALLEIWPEGDIGPTAKWNLKLGRLDPLEKLSGIQARLNNLGYYCGKEDGIDGPKTKRAVKAFQADHELKVDGIAGPKTQAALKNEYGC